MPRAPTCLGLALITQCMLGTNVIQCGISNTAVFSMTVNYHKNKSFSGLQVDGGGVTVTRSGFGGLEVACWPLVPKFAGSKPAEAVGFFRAKKSSARLPSDGK